MSRKPNRKEEIERWVSSKKDEGRKIQDFSRNTYFIDDKKTNIHFASPRKDGTFWYKIRLMSEREDSSLTFDDVINNLLDKASK